jgi:hypothetical protein
VRFSIHIVPICSSANCAYLNLLRTTDLNIQSDNQQGGNKSVFVTLKSRLKNRAIPFSQEPTSALIEDIGRPETSYFDHSICCCPNHQSLLLRSLDHPRTGALWPPYWSDLLLSVVENIFGSSLWPSSSSASQSNHLSLQVDKAIPPKLPPPPPFPQQPARGSFHRAKPLSAADSGLSRSL